MHSSRSSIRTGIALLILALLPFFSCYLPIPPELQELRVVYGEGFLTKEIIEFPLDAQGRKRDIIELKPVPNDLGVSRYVAYTATGDQQDPDLEIIYFDLPSGTIESSVPVDPDVYGELFDLDGDGRFELVISYPNYVYDGEIVVGNSDGHLAWRKIFPQFSDEFPLDLDVGDLDGDGIQEICVALRRSLACYRMDGEQLWRREGDYDYVIVVGANETTQGVVIARAGTSVRRLRGSDGSLLGQWDPNRYLQFHEVDWPVEAGGPALLSRPQYGPNARFLDPEGNTLFFHNPQSNVEEGFYLYQANRIAFSDEEVFVALLFSSRSLSWNRVSLLFYSEDGEFVYRETLSSFWGPWRIPDPTGPGEVFALSDEDGRLVLYRKAP
ncbi:MAG: FG-GAP-like repeat-containing protein [Planctomycetota bacterium]